MGITIRHDGSPAVAAAAAYTAGKGKRRAEDARLASQQVSQALLQDSAQRARAAEIERARAEARRREEEARQNALADRDALWKRDDDLRKEARDNQLDDRAEARQNALDDRRANWQHELEVYNRKRDDLASDRLENWQHELNVYEKKRGDALQARDLAESRDNETRQQLLEREQAQQAKRDRQQYFDQYFIRRHTPEQLKQIALIQDELNEARRSGKYTQDELAKMAAQAEDKIYSIKPEYVSRDSVLQPATEQEQQQNSPADRAAFDKRFDAAFNALKTVDENGNMVIPTTEQVLSAMREKDRAYDAYRGINADGRGAIDGQQEGAQPVQDRAEEHVTPASQIAAALSGGAANDSPLESSKNDQVSKADDMQKLFGNFVWPSGIDRDRVRAAARDYASRPGAKYTEDEYYAAMITELNKQHNK